MEQGIRIMVVAIALMFDYAMFYPECMDTVAGRKDNGQARYIRCESMRKDLLPNQFRMNESSKLYQ
jgi:hypothetical protein